MVSTGSTLRLVAVAIAVAGGAWAQPAPPGAVSPVRPLLPPRPPSVAPGAATPAPASPAAVPDLPRAVQAVTVEGVTAYPAARLAPVLADLTGPAVPQARIEGARVALVNLYRGDGYVATAVNAVLAGGRLTFVVTEGRIVAVKLDGDIGPAGIQVLRFLERLTEVRPLSVSALERAMLLANDVPGVSARAVLNPSETDPGALTLVAQVSRQKFSALGLVDNRAAPTTGPVEMLGVFDGNSFTQFGERTEVQLYHTGDNAQNFGQLSTEFFVGGSGLKVRLYGGAGNAWPTGPLAAIGYNGWTQLFGASVSYPVIRARAQTLNVTGILDGLQYRVDTNTGAGRTRTSFDSTRVLRLGADYALLDDWAGPEMSAVNGVSGRLSQGLQWLGASRNGSTDAQRLGSAFDFTKVNFQVSRNQTLFAPWEGASVALQGVLAGQYSGAILPSSEKFYLGGPHFNRGYWYGQVTGDSALAGSVELQLNQPLPKPGFVPFDSRAQFYLFWDWGETWNSTRLDRDAVLNSVGGGVRLYLSQFVELDFEGVARLNRFPNGSSPGVSALYSGAFYWQLLARF